MVAIKLTKEYFTVDGKLLGERRENESRMRGYVHDALGSVQAVFQAGAVKATGTYYPFGQPVSASWNISDYKFQYVGGYGYRATGLDWVNQYVRARHYSYNDANWTTVDPLWPDEQAYRYVDNRAMTNTDPSGMKPCDAYIGKKGTRKFRTACGSIDLPIALGGFPPTAKPGVLAEWKCVEYLLKQKMGIGGAAACIGGSAAIMLDLHYNKQIDDKMKHCIIGCTRVAKKEGDKCCGQYMAVWLEVRFWASTKPDIKDYYATMAGAQCGVDFVYVNYLLPDKYEAKGCADKELYPCYDCCKKEWLVNNGWK